MKLDFSFFFPLNRLVKKTRWYRSVIPDLNNYPTNQWYRENLQRNYDIVNIGSTSARYAFDYTGLPVKAFNWADQPQALEYGFKVLQKYYSILKRGGVVIISISPFSGFDISGKWPVGANDRYYYILDPYNIDDYESVKRRRNWPLYADFIPSVKALVREGLKKDADVHQLVDFEQDALRWMNGWLKEFNISSIDSDISPANSVGRIKRIRLLSDIVGFCNERCLKPVVVLPPMHEALRRLFTDKFIRENIYGFVMEAIGQECEFYDYMSETSFQKDQYFKNAFMMNEMGAGLFTRSLLKRLGII